MKNNNLLKTNLLVSIILIIGFAVTAVLSYRASYETSMGDIEQVSSLTAEGIYYQLTTMFARPVNISLTMAHDSLLAEHLNEEMDHLNDDEYVETIKTYLETYRKRYSFDSVFLVSCATNRYYNFNGVDRVLKEDNPENVWYYELKDSNDEYSLNVDNDEVDGADNAITVFVNCKVTGPEGGPALGIIGVGIRIDYLKDMLKSYEDKYNLEASLIGQNGIIDISTTYTGYEKKDWFQVYGKESLRNDILGWDKDTTNLELWTESGYQSGERSYVVTRYIPELKWHLIVEQNTGQIIRQIHIQLYQTGFIIAAVIIIVLVVITAVIRNFNLRITELIEERQAVFKRATEQLYDNIYEFNITKNSYVGKRTEDYFGSQGAKDLPYDQGLRVIAEKQIKKEYRAGYVSTFAPENLIREYDAGNNHLRYDFLITQDGTSYHWMRIDAYVFYSAEDESLHMFTYRKNIDAEKQKELQASIDEMTGFFTKMATERIIEEMLNKYPEEMHGFFIFDIDNFKQANDLYGHIFGDYCIRKFTEIIRAHFREKDICGRIGGDEFVVFIPVPKTEWAVAKAEEMSEALSVVCEVDGVSWSMSASIGIALFPRDGTSFAELYRKADTALYLTKQKGKGGFSVYGGETTI